MQSMGTRSAGVSRTLFLDLPRAGAARCRLIVAAQPLLPCPAASIFDLKTVSQVAASQPAAAQTHA